jgi:FKBP-type peptidyl-prolyl cis-trans isomerase (trigger factor)
MAAVDKIVELEGLVATQEELTQAITVICRNNGITPEDLKDIYDEEFEKAVMRSVLTGKVMAFIREAATVTEV